MRIMRYQYIDVYLVLVIAGNLHPREHVGIVHPTASKEMEQLPKLHYNQANRPDSKQT